MLEGIHVPTFYKIKCYVMGGGGNIKGIIKC